MRFAVFTVPDDCHELACVHRDPRDGDFAAFATAGGTPMETVIALLPYLSSLELQRLKLDLILPIQRRVTAEERTIARLAAEESAIPLADEPPAEVQAHFDRAIAEELDDMPADGIQVWDGERWAEQFGERADAPHNVPRSHLGELS